MKKTHTVVALALAFAVVVCVVVVRGGDATATQPAKGEKRTTESGLTIVDMRGEPLKAQKGDLIWVNYTGRLQSNGQKFDSSYDNADPQTGISPDPIKFVLGIRKVIAGWDEGIAGMRVGDRRQLIIPPNLAYGAEGSGPIPPNSTLVFDIELVGLQRPAQPQQK